MMSSGSSPEVQMELMDAEDSLNLAKIKPSKQMGKSITKTKLNLDIIGETDAMNEETLAFKDFNKSRKKAETIVSIN